MNLFPALYRYPAAAREDGASEDVIDSLSKVPGIFVLGSRDPANMLTISNDPPKQRRAGRDAEELDEWLRQLHFWSPKQFPEKALRPFAATSLDRSVDCPEDPPLCVGICRAWIGAAGWLAWVPG